jgi:hypothetical protein
MKCGIRAGAVYVAVLRAICEDLTCADSVFGNWL